jgi:hypothetical protein
MDVDKAFKIVSTTETGWRVISVCVPTRAIRVIADDMSLRFRVEQLDPRTYSWRPISTHAGDIAFEAYGNAIQDAIVKQARLKEKIKLAAHERRMAMLKAQTPVTL